MIGAFFAIFAAPFVFAALVIIALIKAFTGRL